MKVIYSDIHLQHAPEHQFNVNRMGAYSETPDRALRILDALSPSHDIVSPTNHGPEPLAKIHNSNYLHFLENVYKAWHDLGGSDKGLIPFTFSRGKVAHIPDDLVRSAGHYCFDAQTPIVAGTYNAARASADCALTAADLVRSGERVAYALCRPPGHHASSDLYGGYCYLNNAAVAAARLGSRIAIIDIDYHHGNGTQDVFYDDPDTLFISLHADPNRAYPFFSGVAQESGAGNSTRTSLNIPLPSDITDDDYLAALASATARITDFSPTALVISAGFDIYKDDPLGDFNITLTGLTQIAEALSALDLPTVIVQEGGYNTDALGTCASHFLAGF
jgi:acetoin utilization deacetylase AcuC-like enzyme